MKLQQICHKIVIISVMAETQYPESALGLAAMTNPRIFPMTPMLFMGWAA
jgi:hypothetical protein